ncbi:MAG TPA: nucleotidyltransferase domain-containing protein [bacterium]
MQAKLSKENQTLAQIDPQTSQIIQSFAHDTKRMLKDNVIAEYLFGSYAKQTHTHPSDIDILIIVKQTSYELQWQMGGLASEYSLKHQVCLSPILQDFQNWKKHQRYDTLFYQEITKYGIQL